jgi:esterase/lipase
MFGWFWLLLVNFLIVLYGLASLLAHQTFKRLDSLFEPDPILNVYQEAQPVIHIPPNCERCLLVITGFANTPLGLKDLMSQLDDNVGYYIPRNVGWGRCDFRIAHNLEWQDWVLRYQEAYHLLKEICPRVDIVAHSAGCNIAAFLVSRLQVKRLYLIAPNLIHNPQHRYHKLVLLFPFIGKFLCSLFPLFPDGPSQQQKESYLKEGYYHNSIPTNAVREMWKMQDACLHLDKWNITERSWIFMDPFDQVVGSMEEQIKIIMKRTPTLKVKVLENAGHNVISMPDEVLKTIVETIQQG